MAESSPSLRRIRLVWIGRLGDVLIATPFFAALRKANPDARISLVTAEGGAQAASLCPDLDEVLVVRKFTRPLCNLALAAKVFGEKADLLVDLNTAHSRASGALCALARAEAKIAFRRGREDVFFSRLVPAPTETEHMLDRYGRLAAELELGYDPRPRARVPEADRAEAARVLEALKLPRGARPVLVFAGNFKKFDNRWPEEKFAALLDALRARNDVAPILLSGPGEEAAVRAIAASRPVPVLGPYPIGLTAALIERAGLLVSSATGTAHLAVAVGATLVSVLGRYTRAIWMPKPGAPKHFCAVSESWTSCRDVPVEKVLAELDRALRADAAPARG